MRDVKDVKPATPSRGSSGAVAAQKKEFKADELRQALMPTLEKLFKLEESLPFRQPVDVHALGIPVRSGVYCALNTYFRASCATWSCIGVCKCSVRYVGACLVLSSFVSKRICQESSAPNGHHSNNRIQRSSVKFCADSYLAWCCVNSNLAIRIPR